MGTMKLDGGINMYSMSGERYKSEESPAGRKVKFLNDNGYDIQREHANKFFEEGQVLTIKEIYVGRSSSEVEFVEAPGERFNTVMFADIPTVYVVCQTGKCQQTYPMEYFGEITKDTKNVFCEKCGGILIDKNGRANFSQNAAVIPVIRLDELEEQRQQELKRKRKELKQLQKEIKDLESGKHY